MKKHQIVYLSFTFSLLVLFSCFSGEEKLLEAAKDDNLSKIEKLIKQDVDLNAKDTEGMTALHILSHKGSAQSVAALLENGADPNIKNNSGKTPLFLVPENGNLELAGILLSHGADIRVRDSDGQEPIHVAAQYGNDDMIRLFIANGADPGVEDNGGNRPSSIAADNGHDSTADLLLKITADIQTAETALLNNDYFAAANGFMDAGVIEKATDNYILALDTDDFNLKKRCLIGLGKIGNRKAIEAIKHLTPRSNAQTRKIISFILKRHGPEKISVVMLDTGEAGRRAIDGYLTSFGIITELSQINQTQMTPDLYHIVEKILGESKYTFEKRKIPALKTPSNPPEFTIDKEKINEALKKQDYDIMIITYSSWYEHTKHIQNNWDKPPLKMDVEYSYRILIPSFNEDKSFSYKFFHEESSDLGREAEQKLARRKTAALWSEKEAETMKEIESYLGTLL